MLKVSRSARDAGAAAYCPHCRFSMWKEVLQMWTLADISRWMSSRVAHFSEAIGSNQIDFFLTQTFRGGHMFLNTNLIYHGQWIFFRFNKFVLKEGLTKVNKLNTTCPIGIYWKQCNGKPLGWFGNIQTQGKWRLPWGWNSNGKLGKTACILLLPQTNADYKCVCWVQALTKPLAGLNW